MSKLFFKGRIDKREDYGNYDYTAKRTIRYGTEQAPLALTVTSEKRKLEVDAILEEHSIVATITIDEEGEENINELKVFLDKPKTIVLEKTPNRNDLCPCASGKKYKKCCG